MSTKPKTKIERGPTAERVAANVRQVREERGLSLEGLSQRMSDIGRPIVRTGIAKIENGERRVDVDDLMALAIALAVTPNRLLLESPVTGEPIGLTPDVYWPDAWAWSWASGEGRRTEEGALRAPGDPSWTPGYVSAWETENRPHRPPIRLTMHKDWEIAQRFFGRQQALRAEVAEAGYDPRMLTDNVVFEAVENRAEGDS